jgi:lipid-binding SYLF domain-containing protein
MATALRRLFVVFALVAGCASVPKTHAGRSQLRADAIRTQQGMVAKDPSLQPLIDQAAGHIVFPEIGQGGFIVGGASGKGVIFEKGSPTGFAELSQASVGAQVGGQKYAEMVIVRDRETLDRIKSGQFDLGGQASAVILREGAGTGARFGNNGVAVVVNPIAGAMVSASITGQQIKATM